MAKSSQEKSFMKDVRAWMKNYINDHPNCYYSGSEITFPIESYNEKQVLSCVESLFTYVKPLVPHDKIVSEKLHNGYPKPIFWKILCFGVWSEENHNPARVLEVHASVGGPYAKVWVQLVKNRTSFL